MDMNSSGWTVVCQFTSVDSEEIQEMRYSCLPWYSVEEVMLECVNSLDTLGLQLMQFYVHQSTQDEYLEVNDAS